MRAKLFVMALVLASAAGCEGMFSHEAPHFSAAVPLTAPWDALKLPVADGVVTFSDATTMTAQHTGQTPDALAPKYTDALTAAGWSKEADTSAGGIVNQTWTKESTSVAFTVMDRDGAAVVSLSVLPF